MNRDLVLAYLNAMEAREIDNARALLAPGFAMTFPGGRNFSTLEAMIDWSKDRYRFVRKTYTGFDEVAGDGVTILYCRGFLNGERLDGEAITDVRFIDRFTIQNGKITDQQVWNDLAEYR